MTSLFITNPPALKSQSTVNDLETRLDWGEPALTSIDVREHAAFSESHIQGAISMPLDTLVEMASRNLEQERDIYLYSDSDSMTTDAANQLRTAGYQHVAELLGGLSAWKTAQYPVEGI